MPLSKSIIVPLLTFVSQAAIIKATGGAHYEKEEYSQPY